MQRNTLVHLFLLSQAIQVQCSALYYYRADSKFLNVGEELLRETLPLQMGLRLYQLQGVKPYTWYEVKISYPASVCIFKSFSCCFLGIIFLEA